MSLEYASAEASAEPKLLVAECFGSAEAQNRRFVRTLTQTNIQQTLKEKKER